MDRVLSLLPGAIRPLLSPFASRPTPIASSTATEEKQNSQPKILDSDNSRQDDLSEQDLQPPKPQLQDSQRAECQPQESPLQEPHQQDQTHVPQQYQIVRSRGKPHASIFQTAVLLRRLPLPAELIPDILDHAELWHHQEGIRTRNTHRISENRSGGVYLAASIPANVAPSSLRSIKFTVRSHDQGWSSYPNEHGTYSGSWTWFEGAIIERAAYERATRGARGSTSIRLRTEGKRIITNVHASSTVREHVVTWRWDDTDEAIAKAFRALKEDAAGKMIAVLFCARYPGWENHVHHGKSPSLDVESAFAPS